MRKKWNKTSTTVHICGIGNTSLTSSDRPIAAALSQAINNIENGIENNKTDEDKRLEAQTIIDMWEQNKNNLSEDIAKAIDELLIAYLKEWNDNSLQGDLYNVAVGVNKYLKERGYQGQTAYDIINNNKENPEQWVNQETEEEEAGVSTGGAPGLLGESDVSASHTPDKIIGNAQDFKNAGNATIPISGDNVQKGSSTLYNILLSIAFFLAVAIGMYLGVKFMLANAEDKAKIKEALIPYIAGCVVIFGAFAIWKIAITLLSGIK